jgi:hypothetical protein
MEAACSGNVEIVKMLVEKGATPSTFVDNAEFKV